MNYTFQEQLFDINRYPTTQDRSLQPWNAADEHLLNYLISELPEIGQLTIYNDRFGFLSCLLQSYNPTSVIDYKSQEKAIAQNIAQNNITPQQITFSNPLSTNNQSIDVALIKIPKSLDLFKLYLQHLSEGLSPNATVLAAFMTKYFSPQFLEIASDFFEEVEQSKAWKKSRILILRKPKKQLKTTLIHPIKVDEEQSFQQYYGVFSAKHIDYASQFLIEHLIVPTTVNKALDLASGNGILAASVRKQQATCEIHLLDDFYLAIESSKLNLGIQNVVYHYNNSLENIADNYFDFVVSNPPFHFEHENNIDISLELFREVYRCMVLGGEFVLVANKHLNYKTHLATMFEQTSIVAENEKFIIYKCVKQ